MNSIAPVNARVFADMLAALEDALEYAEDRADVVDGDYGMPQANKAMQLATMLRGVIAKARA